MSLKTWKEEFYPQEAGTVSEDDAIAHSLLKWHGLRKVNLICHNVVLSESAVFEESSGDSLGINASSCALCCLYVNTMTYECPKCPLSYQGKTCGQQYLQGIAGDPEPMITLLESK